ncbi:MAG: [NiFe]-hydrogenase assembly chaperone HybE [Burkholderiaceae bacterium]|nr:[NiFe]-hydrogenase assembly chaperone HybE [Burkholderiaceae bacterium]
MDAVAPSAAAAAPSPAIAQRPDPSAQLERVFAEIHATRMQGLPFVNPALRVEAVGFRRWDGRWLGVLITPWFMNLMLVPDADAGWHHVRYGDSVSYALPAGVFEFISAREPLLGDYQSCSLFSPVFEFADPDGARATAVAALAALFDAQSRAGAEGPGTALSGTAGPATAPAAASAPPSDAAPAPAVSKRDFLRGRWHASRGQ